MTIHSILVVDDSEDDRYIVRRMLREVNPEWAIFESENGADALTFLRDYDAHRATHKERFPPTIILLDINMPVMDGFQFLQAFNSLNDSPKYDSVILAMVSSSGREQDRELALSYPYVRGFIEKWPASAQELGLQIETMWAPY